MSNYKYRLLGVFLLSVLCLTDANAEITVSAPPESIKDLEPITFACIDSASRLSELDACRQKIELQKENVEDFNRRVKRYCDGLISYDGELRGDAAKHKISWREYEDAKEKIKAELKECSPEDGELYSPYRARMREYRAAMKLHDSKRDSILNGPVLIGGQ